MEYNNQPYEQYNQTQVVGNVVASRLMRSVFLWMTIGLGISALSAYVMFDKDFDIVLLQSPGLYIGLCIAEFVLVLIFSAAISRMSFGFASLIFGVYSLLNGVTLSPILLLYTGTSVMTTFLITAGTFGTMAILGYTTKMDLSKMGKILYMALFGLIIVILVNLFLRNPMMDYIVSGIGVLLFTGLTMYDVNKIKRLMANVYEEDNQTRKLALLGALTLYLDFINLFLFLLRFLGKRN
ncbi:MAG: Bax inhibitor-1/YccA family protein [Porphyromonas sp.]|nr:Bax inhibitor-1/YccA family protein [Porphyromonas sp.]